MSDSREVWVIRKNFGGQQYPSTWRGWLATLLFGALVIAMVAVAAVIASALFVFLMVAVVIAVLVGFVRFAFFRAAGARSDDDIRRNYDA
jgi:uncharacterized membrane protein